MGQQEQQAIDDLINKVVAQENEGGSKFPGMTYEQGIKATIEWLEGNGPNPLAD